MRDSGLQRRGRAVAALAVLTLGAATSLLLSIGGLLLAAGPASGRARTGTSFGVDVAVAVAGALASLVLAMAAVHAEHQLRHGHPVAQAWSGPDRPRLLGGRRYSPATRVVQAVVLTGVCVVLIVGSVRTHGEGSRSDRVQHHGILAPAKVTSMETRYHPDKNGGFYTTDIDAIAAYPAGAATMTVLHVPGRVTGGVGSSYQVLLDPANLAYSELPHRPATTDWQWVVFALMAAVLGVADAAAIRAALRLLAHRRRVS